MEQTLSPLQDKLAAAEELFFTWLLRVIAAAILVGSAWIDDAPPLGLAAAIIALYVVIRLITQFGAFVAAAPFQSRVPKVMFAIGSLFLLGMSFATVVIFTERIAILVVG